MLETNVLPLFSGDRHTQVDTEMYNGRSRLISQ